jgi:MYXO-CTERM domain-containing protein
MTDRTMRGLLRHAFASAPLLALVPLLAPSLAAAQTTQAIDNNLIVKRNGRVVENSTIVYADVADCGGEDGTGDGSEFEFSVSYNTNVPVVEAWLGVGNINCATASNRLRSNTALPTNCTFLESEMNNPRTPVITVAGKRLFDKDGGREEEVTCDAVSGSPTYTVYILPLPMATTDTVAPEVIPGTISTLRATFTPFTRRPTAPTNLRGERGESRLGVNFDAPSNSVALTKYRAYFDISGGSGGGDTPSSGIDGGLIDASVADGSDASTGTSGDGGSSGSVSCGSGLLRGNAPAPVNQAGIRTSGSSNSESVSLTDLGDVPLGTSVAVAAVTIDPAGNESLLSTPICIDRVPTEGYLDSCQANDDCDLDGCSAHPGGTGGTMGLSLFALALAALIRRRGRA